MFKPESLYNLKCRMVFCAFLAFAGVLLTVGVFKYLATIYVSWDCAFMIVLGMAILTTLPVPTVVRSIRMLNPSLKRFIDAQEFLEDEFQRHQTDEKVFEDHPKWKKIVSGGLAILTNGFRDIILDWHGMCFDNQVHLNGTIGGIDLTGAVIAGDLVLGSKLNIITWMKLDRLTVKGNVLVERDIAPEVIEALRNACVGFTII